MLTVRISTLPVITTLAISLTIGLARPGVALGDDVIGTALALLQSLASGSSADSHEFPATHQQIGLIKVLEGSDAQGRKLQSFCLNADGKLLAAVSNPGEIRVIDPEGELLTTWTLPVVPEAINRDSDGSVLVAGEGLILRVNANGEVELKQEAPHVAAIKQNSDALRAQIVKQAERASKSLRRQIDTFEKRIRDLKRLTVEQERELAALKSAIAQTADRREGDLTDTDREAVRLRRQLVRLIEESIDANLSEREQAMISSYQQRIDTYKQFLQQHNSEPTKAQIDQQLQQMLVQKSRVSSISASSDHIFLVTGATKGHGFDVWRTTRALEQGQKIVSGLRGCCGQMDVQSNEQGLFVAENSRHRVSQYDAQGELLANWGKRARKGVRGFGGCCNPMNVAFGIDGSVYTAESGSGRIKRYDRDGNLLDLVGAVELVPGCKKVSIAVNDDGSRVFMLDITRNHIIVMGTKKTDGPSLAND